LKWSKLIDFGGKGNGGPSFGEDIRMFGDSAVM